MSINRVQDVSELTTLTGERAKLDAKANRTYIVYKMDKGESSENMQIAKSYHENPDVTHQW